MCRSSWREAGELTPFNRGEPVMVVRDGQVPCQRLPPPAAT